MAERPMPTAAPTIPELSDTWAAACCLPGPSRNQSMLHPDRYREESHQVKAGPPENKCFFGLPQKSI